MPADDARAEALLADLGVRLERPKTLPPSPRQLFKLHAIKAWRRACAAISGIRTEQARAICADESTLRDWESPNARQIVPLWAAFALPRDAKVELIRALAETIEP